jgi:4-hydroxybenzoate polyprenyltransferase
MINPPKPEPTWLSVIRLLRWDKPSGRLILLIPALWGLCLASRGKPDFILLGVMVLGTLATSALGCVVNDLWDRDIDPQVERTKNRPLAQRSLSVFTGIIVAIVSLGCAGVLAIYLNPWVNPLTFWLCVAAVPVIIFYPTAKRVFPIPQLILSIAWGFAVLISWSAVTKNLEEPTFFLWLGTISWTLGFDTIYAMADREDDRRIKINSSALFFGDYAPEVVMVCFAMTAGSLAFVGIFLNLGQYFWISEVLATILWFWQYFRLRNHELPTSAYGAMFRENVWVGFLLLLGMVVGSN